MYDDAFEDRWCLGRDIIDNGSIGDSVADDGGEKGFKDFKEHFSYYLEIFDRLFSFMWIIKGLTIELRNIFISILFS